MSEAENTSQNNSATQQDANELAEKLSAVAEQSQNLISEFLQHQYQDPSIAKMMDPGAAGRVFTELMQQMWLNPAKVMQHQVAMWQDFWELSNRMTQRAMGVETEAVISPAKDDRRFKDDEWSDNPVFDYIKQSYLIASKHILANVQDVDGMDDKTAKQVDFYTRLYVDAMAPTNFAASNPKVLREARETGGESLVNGLQNLLEDIDARDGKLRVKMSDTSAFEMGKDVAATPGKVVFQNELMQLLQFTPTTEKVHKTPLLIIPPWINKYYILDLREKNSFIKWAVDEGHTVFVISWVNPDERLAAKGFEDYLYEGPLAALDAIEKATGEKSIKAIGYCIGGTLLATTLAYMAAKNDKRIKAATFFTTMVDFAEPGELGVFIDDEQLDALDEEMQRKGYLDGSEMAQSFNMLRANDLIWSFVINNYLMGKEPLPFDLLYWNSDSTRMPSAMHSFYLRNMYLHNQLVEPGGITIGDVAIDLRKIETPAYIISTRDDHIAPWKSTYAATQLYQGPVRFVLGGSGHIAGIVNPPAAKKYDFSVNEAYPADPDEWLEEATTEAGSWWTDWAKWVRKYNGGKKVEARTPGDGLQVLEDAPGSFAKHRIT
ncbi:MAG: class I poly(R)-hydroxyalkanoic acid synthase [Pseudomonadota bacterium]